jgi:hypothetical protein
VKGKRLGDTVSGSSSVFLRTVLTTIEGKSAQSLGNLQKERAPASTVRHIKLLKV